MKRISDIVGMAVVNSEGNPMGEVDRVLCSRIRGRVMGIILKRKKISRNNAIVHYKDILSFGDDLLIINGRLLSQPSNIPEIDHALEEEDIMGYSVLTAEGREIGEVRDTVINEASGNIEGYLVAGDLYEDLMKGRKVLKLDKSAIVGNGSVILDGNEAADRSQKPGGLENLLKLNE